MKLPIAFGVLCVVIGLVGMSIKGAESAAPVAGTEASPETAKPIRVGVFDSRAVALAYCREHFQSTEFKDHLKQLKDERDRAKAAGDEEKAKKLEAQGEAGQEQVHLQIFGTAPVDEIVAKIKDQLPEIARQAGVDLIVSKWNLTYQSSEAAVIDVTELMVKPFHPDEKTMKIIHDLAKQKPLSAEEIKNAKGI
jgi:hypothetical protein